MKLALILLVIEGPLLVTTSLQQDIDLFRAHQEWEHQEPITYILFSLIKLYIMYVLIRRIWKST